MWLSPIVQSQGSHHALAPVPEQKSSVELTSHLVTLQVTVTDLYGRFIKGLKEHHFSVYDSDVEQEIAFFNGEDVPLSLGIVYDTSGSMKSVVDEAFKALSQFMDTSHQDDDFFLIGFNSRAHLLEDFTRQADRIMSSLILAAPKGRTALYDAVYLGLEKVRQGAHAKRALLIISDGQDNNSAYTYRHVRNRVKESEVLIYAIGIVDPWDEAAAQMRGFEVLGEITRMTGGRVFYPRKGAELINVCAHIASELRRQYSIGYYPQDAGQSGRWHKLRVQVHPPKGFTHLQVRTREGYFAY
ncbi:MAG: VWA domain-containing protein [Acidobacteria bacterium]|nr:VWA domain-containing protein [Acidobacteriota bacterium]